MRREFLFNISPLKPQRTKLRNTPTPSETILWRYLRKKQLNYTFRRQFSVGPYVLDFYCPAKHLAIELDGKQHQSPDKLKYDKHRTRYLNSLNIKVLRFWNEEAMNQTSKVIEKIETELTLPP
jgi:very-short-patch-repair endonuclease